MDELVAMNNGESGLAPQASNVSAIFVEQ